MLQFVLGDVLRHKQAWCLQDMQQLLQAKTVQRVFYLVPEHIKFDSEIDIIANQPTSASIDVQVYSFSRLAWFLLKETGVLNQTQLSKIGLSMLVRKVLHDCQDDLIVFRSQVGKAGFIEQLTNLFLELRAGTITHQDLAQFLTHQSPADDVHAQNMYTKLSEINRLYTAFTQALLGKYIEKETLYATLVEYIQQYDFSQSVIYLHGFERFSAQEQQIVVALMQRAYKVTVSLPLTRVSLAQEQSVHSLRYVPEKTYRQLYTCARQLHIPILQDVFVKEGIERYQPSIQALVKSWEDLQDGKEPAVYTQNHHLYKQQFSSKQAEVSAAVSTIRYLISHEGYRYKDIYVVMRQVEDYELILQPLLQESDIPYFMDNAESMAYHPLVELLSALYGIQKRNWAYEDMMRLLRSELVLADVSRDVVDQLENTVLAEGYRGLAQWQGEWDKDNHLNQQVVKLIVPYIKTLNKATTMADAARELYLFLEEAGVTKQLLAWRDSLLADNQLEAAKRHEQVWQTFIDLLDEFVDVLGTSPFDLDSFYQILLGGFESAEYSLVPPSLDQVTIASLDGKRVNPVKAVIVLGADAQQFPKTYDDNSLLNQEEKEAILAKLSDTQYLPLSSQYRTFVEPFIAYQLFASATERFYFFYVQKQNTALSPYIQLLDKVFHFHALPDTYRYSTYRQALRYLLKQLRHVYDDARTLNQETRALWHFLANQPATQTALQFLENSLTYDNQPKPLQNAPALYENRLHLSVSQVESFFADPYSHFLQYGLKLQERRLLQLRAADTGNVFHDTLDAIFKRLATQKRSLKQLPMQALQQLAHDTMQTLFDQPQYKLFKQSKSMIFAQQRLEETILHTLAQLQQFDQAIDMQTLATELVFGADKNIKVPSIPLGDERTLTLRGKIDRIDVIDGQYLSVVDYKSSAHKLDFQRMYAGLSLQLLTYLYVVSKNKNHLSQQANELLGSFYYHVQYPYEKVDDIMRINQDVERKQTRLTGLLNVSAQDMVRIDAHADVYRYALTKEQQFNKLRTMPIIQADELAQLFTFLENKLTEAGQRILAGDIRLAPVKNEPFIASISGDYRSISCFDATLPENRYRTLEKITDVKDLLKKAGEQVHEHTD